MVRRRPSALLTSQILLAMLCQGCGNEAAPEPFYTPPDARTRAAVLLEPAVETCERWLQTKLTQRITSAAMVVEMLQQQFLLFGLEEIRVDPLTAPAANQQKHLTASVRGRSQDSILLVAMSPPAEHGNLAPLTAVAKYWSERADPRNPPALTVRFVVLPKPDALATDQVVASYLAQRPRAIEQTKAVVILDPTSGPGLFTNRSQLRDALEAVARKNGLAITTHRAPPAPAAGLAAAFSRLDLPSIWLDLGWRPSSEQCSEGAIARIGRMNQLLLDILTALALPKANSVESPI